MKSYIKFIESVRLKEYPFEVNYIFLNKLCRNANELFRLKDRIKKDYETEQFLNKILIKSKK